MDIKEFSRRMTELLPQCIRGFAQHESNYLSRGQITLPQFWTLEYLSRHGGCLMSELAAYLKISRPAMTGFIDRLIAQGLVRREDIKQDRRAVRVSITQKGEKIVSGVLEQKHRTLVKVFSQISPQDRKQHLIILERIVNILSQNQIRQDSRKHHG